MLPEIKVLNLMCNGIRNKRLLSEYVIQASNNVALGQKDLE